MYFLIICLNQVLIFFHQLIYWAWFLFLLMFSTLSKILTLVLLAKICLWAVNNQSLSVSQSLLNTYLEVSQNIGAMPMFLDKKLEALSEERKWNEVIELTNKVLNQNSNYRGTFKFWYYRALGECALLQIKSCAKSHLSASMFAGEKYQSSIQKMDQFLKLFNPKMSAQRNPQQIESLI